MKLLFVLLCLSTISHAQISEIRKMRPGKTVTASGVVTAVFDDLSFIQDRSGGIAVYRAAALLNDSISVTGKLSRYNGMLEITAESFSVLKQSFAIQSLPVTELKDHEGRLVRIDNLTFDYDGLFFYPKRAYKSIVNDDTIHVWIDEATDIGGYTIPARTSMTGVVGRFGEQLQLLPRSHADIPGATIHYPAPDRRFTVMNWNVQFFGAKQYGPVDDALQVGNVAKVLKFVQPDIVALEEVSNDKEFAALLSQLPEYDGRCSSRY